MRSEDRQHADVDSRLFAAEIGGSVPEVDLHGCDRDDALLALESLIQQAFMQGERTIRIIHGHGTGALRREVQEALRKHPLVEAFRDSSQGGQLGAVTVVALSPRK